LGTTRSSAGHLADMGFVDPHIKEMGWFAPSYSVLLHPAIAGAGLEKPPHIASVGNIAGALGIPRTRRHAGCRD